MKNTLLTAAFALTCALTATAQDHSKFKAMPPEERAKRHAEMMDKKLNLSDEQRAQIERVDLKMAQDMRASSEAMKPEREKMRQNMKSMQANRDAEYKRILTPEQFGNFQKLQEERREKHFRMADEKRQHAQPDAIQRAEPVR